MSPLPIPQGYYPHFSALDPSALANKGIRLVLADLDNTLVTYGQTHPTPEVVAWKEALNAQGITLFILSNSRKAGRVETFAQALDVPFSTWSGKPKKKGYRRALARMDCTPAETVMVGDQIFTDIWGGRRMGITPLLVAPVTLDDNLGRTLRHKILEAPFRNAGKRNPFL